jgi:hypothetical protein
MMRQVLRLRAQPAWVCVLGAALLIGTWLRLDQLAAQVLIDDEWHAVHQLLLHGPGEMLLDFGYADYSIPLGVLYWYEAHWWGLSELAMRAPMLLCGLVSLIAFPVYVAPRMSRATAAVFAVLLAISPLLIVYSRLARPYAITLLLGWIAHAAFQRWHATPGAHRGSGIVYTVTAACAIWLHPLIAPFVLAPLLWGLGELRRRPPAERRAAFSRLALLASATAALVAALVLPPVVANPQSLAAKGAMDAPGAATLIGVWFEWLGTPSAIVVVVCLAVAASGVRDVWRALPEARTGALGLLLTLIAVLLARPMWSFNPLTLARYLLPIVPLLLLFVAAGAVRIARRVATPDTTGGRLLFTALAALPVIALAVQSPLGPMLRQPNAQALDSVHYMDFRPEKNPILPYQEAIPLSSFWASLAMAPPGSLRIAAAPFYFESYDWDAPRWEARARQVVLPAFLTGLCVDRRWGEVPQDSRFRFRNAVHLADQRSLEQRRIDYVVWQKPYVQASKGAPMAIGADTAHCEPALRAKFGPPVFEDSSIIAFRVAPHAQR